MMNPFKQIGDLKRMRDEAMQIQRQLEQEEVRVDKHGVNIVMNGAQRVITLVTNGKSDDDVKEAVNEAIKKSQEVAAKKLSQMGGGLSGLLGGH